MPNFISEITRTGNRSCLDGCFLKQPLKFVTFPGFRGGGGVQEDHKAYERVRMCIKCVAYKAVPLFVSSCFLSLANLYEEVLCGLTAEEVWKLVLDYKRTAVHLISV